MNLILVIVGAAVGAPLRYVVDRTVQERHRGVFPFGTLTVNLIASLVLGVVTGAVGSGAASAHVPALVGIGLCATLSTYSTFSFETVRLSEQGYAAVAVANVVGSIVLGVLAAYAGAGCASLIWG